MLHALFQCYCNMGPYRCNVTCFISVLLTIWGHMDAMLHALFQCYCNMGPHGCNVTCFISVLLQYGATWMQCYMLYFSVTAIWGHMDVMLHALFQCYCNMGPLFQCYCNMGPHVMLHALFQCYCNMGPHGCNVTCFISVLLQYGATWM